MSLSDILQLFGTGSVPVIVAGTVYGVFELGEKLASQRAKDALSKWLLTFDVQRAKALPDGTREIFERIFGERHFSLKCFVRSVAFSVGAMVFIGIIFFLISPEVALDFAKRFSSVREYNVSLVVWLPWSIIIDYLSLFKTRFILGALTRIDRRNSMFSIVVLGIDYILYRLLFLLGFSLILIAIVAKDYTHITIGAFQNAIGEMVAEVLSFQEFPFVPPPQLALFFIYYWAGFAPSIWMWLYVLALFVTRALLRSERIVNWLRWGLDVEKNPFRSIGAVAAALAFVISVAIILISAEVSRISGAA